jgi:hypothetical protein
LAWLIRSGRNFRVLFGGNNDTTYFIEDFFSTVRWNHSSEIHRVSVIRQRLLQD